MRAILVGIFSLYWMQFSFADSYRLYSPESVSSLNTQKLLQEIQTHRIQSISNLLGVLSQKYPNYMSNYVLVHRSLSLQTASFDNPRVLVFGEDASFVLSFNGSPLQRGYASLEIMEFDRDLREFFFKEITFEKDAQVRLQSANWENLDSLEQSVLKDRTHFQNVTSPQVCTTCHTPYKKPNWDSYPNWPGVYGGSDDRTAGYKEQNSSRNIYAGIESFLAKAETDDRYKFLPGLKKYLESLLNAIPFDEKPLTPNTKFTDFLAELNFDRFFNRIFKLPEYPKYKKALTAAVYGCLESKEIFQSVLKDSDFESLKGYEQDTFLRTQRNRVLKRDQVIDFENPDLSISEKSAFTSYGTPFGMIHASRADLPFVHLRYVVEAVLKDTMFYDSMSFNPATYDFLVGSSHHLKMQNSYLKQLKTVDFARYTQLKSLIDLKLESEDFCETLIR